MLDVMVNMTFSIATKSTPTILMKPEEPMPANAVAAIAKSGFRKEIYSHTLER
jgi:hypothetical protein